jgi:hypothetical protein
MLSNTEQFRVDYKESMKKQKEVWEQYINKNGWYFLWNVDYKLKNQLPKIRVCAGWGGEMILTKHLTELVCAGIPDEFRGRIFLILVVANFVDNSCGKNIANRYALAAVLGFNL